MSDEERTLPLLIEKELTESEKKMNNPSCFGKYVCQWTEESIIQARNCRCQNHVSIEILNIWEMFYKTGNMAQKSEERLE